MLQKTDHHNNIKMNNPNNTEVIFFYLSFTITITLTVQKMAIKLTTYQKSAQSAGFWSL